MMHQLPSFKQKIPKDYNIQIAQRARTPTMTHTLKIDFTQSTPVAPKPKLP